MTDAFINSIGKFLPGNGIDNDRVEEFLGKINNSASKIKNRILKSNGIKQRYYALDNQQNITYRNSEMAAHAVKDTISQINLEPEAIDLLACATSWSDLLVPSFASMVHGELPQLSSLEIISTQGVCCAGIAALNYAYAQIQLGKRKNAIAVASELASRLFINTKFEVQDKIKKGEKLPFDTEFLRWMLSDSAGAFLIQDRPRTGEDIFCFVPESGRYTTAYMMLKVVEECDRIALSSFQNQQPQQSTLSSPVDNLNTNNSTAAELLKELTSVWLEFDRRLHSVSIVRKLERGEFTLEDYKALLRNLRPQVVEGARWIARAASNMVDFRLRSTFIGHAQEEHRDFQMLERNYVSVGGKLEEIVTAQKNIGSEALSAFIFDRASRDNPVDLIGSIFIIEGLGNQMAGKWASLIKKTLNLTDEQVSF